MAGSAFHREQRSGSGLAAEREALHEAQANENERCGDADLRVRRHETDQGRRCSHQRQRRDHDRLAADAIPEMPEEQPSDRPRREADREHTEHRDRADQRIETREEQAVEDERGQEAVEQEVIPLDRRAEETRR